MHAVIKTPADHEALIDSLMDPQRWAGGGDRRRIDTHISTVVLAGEFAYKIKKPLDLGFLNFLTLDARRDACHEELRLNVRLAPDIYQRVCTITGDTGAPEIDGPGEVIDWAVRMQRFDPNAILSRHPGRLTAELITDLAGRVARFHAGVSRSPPEASFGGPSAVLRPMIDNIDAIRSQADVDVALIDALHAWIVKRHAELTPLLERRREEGHVRECHGDLHLGNVALIDDEPVVFDAIEFNPELRWIDTVDDFAFLTMDLHERGREDLAHRFLDAYLQHSGDYQGMALLSLYEVYRAMVRAKIASIRLGQLDLEGTARAPLRKETTDYLALAHKLTAKPEPVLLLMSGVSGSGKSTVAAEILDWLPAVRLRSDVERKRLLGIAAGSDASGGGYGEDMTQRTYVRLERLATEVLAAGYSAVLDATFLQAARRQRFHRLALRLGVPYRIIDCDAPQGVLRQRVLDRRGRKDNVSDADIGVLERQLRSRQPLGPEERCLSIEVRPGHALTRARLDAALRV